MSFMNRFKRLVLWFIRFLHLSKKGDSAWNVNEPMRWKYKALSWIYIQSGKKTTKKIKECYIFFRKKYPNNTFSTYGNFLYKFSWLLREKKVNREEDVQNTGIRVYYCTRMCRVGVINQVNLQILCIFFLSVASAELSEWKYFLLKSIAICIA